MIDFHTHIIPNVDDGSDDIQSTFDLFREAESVGFDSIILTPHYIENYYEVDKKTNGEWADALEKVANSQGIRLNLYLGNENYFSNNLINLLTSGKASTINNSRYLLMEFPTNAKPLNIFGIIKELVNNGITPIIAHPERYSFVQSDPNLVCDLIQSGALTQCNFGSVVGLYGKRAQVISKRLLKNNLVYFLGSDVHKPNTIYQIIPDAIKEIKKITGDTKFNIITCENPIRVLQNEEIDAGFPRKIELTLKEKFDLK